MGPSLRRLARVMRCRRGTSVWVYASDTQHAAPPLCLSRRCRTHSSCDALVGLPPFLSSPACHHTGAGPDEYSGRSLKRTLGPELKHSSCCLACGTSAAMWKLRGDQAFASCCMGGCISALGVLFNIPVFVALAGGCNVAFPRQAVGLPKWRRVHLCNKCRGCQSARGNGFTPYCFQIALRRVGGL